MAGTVTIALRPHFSGTGKVDGWHIRQGALAAFNKKRTDAVTGFQRSIRQYQAAGYTVRAEIYDTDGRLGESGTYRADGTFVRGHVRNGKATRSNGNNGRWLHSQVQSLLFASSLWTELEAKQWARDHGFRYGQVFLPKTGKYIHLRQGDPADFGRIRTITFSDDRGIKATVGEDFAA